MDIRMNLQRGLLPLKHFRIDVADGNSDGNNHRKTLNRKIS